MSGNLATDHLDEQLGDAETDAFLESEREAENANETNEETDADNSSNGSGESDESVSGTGKEDKKDSGDEEESGEKDEHSGKELSEQERYKAMAAEERNRRRETQKEIEALKQQNQKLSETFNKILQKAQEQSEAEQMKKNVPDPELDPIGYLKWESQQLREKINKFEQKDTQREQMTQQQYEMAQRQKVFIDSYRSKANEFRKVAPDFDNAYQYLLDSRVKEFELAGYSEEQIEQLVHEDEAAIVATAMQKGNNPAASIYEIAKLRGYRKEENTGSSANSGGQSSQQKIEANNQKIANLERGLKVSKSVSGGGSSSAQDNLTLESVAEMSEDEIAALGDAWNKLMKSG